MPSKELIALVSEAIINNPPIETVTDDEIIIDWSPTGKAVASTILAALQEPTEGFDPEKVSYHKGMTRLDWWRAMLAASPLSEER